MQILGPQCNSIKETKFIPSTCAMQQLELSYWRAHTIGATASVCSNISVDFYACILYSSGYSTYTP